MRTLRQWTIPIAILTAWLLASAYTVARLSWANEAWQLRAAGPAAMADSVRTSSSLRVATHRPPGYGQP
jgi:hypothetical protein